MTKSTARTDTVTPSGYPVRRPRASDAIGNALRAAFGEEESMPCGITRALTILERLPG